jgi:hypothetical protein
LSFYDTFWYSRLDNPSIACVLEEVANNGRGFLMAFFPTYKDNWTRTPNVFFDQILKDPKVTTNQIRLVGYLIRQTIGYNREAKWAAVSRSTLIKKAGIPNSRITEAISRCEEKGWILTFEQGEKGKQERYIFLNDPLNVCIVQGLKKGCFAVTDLEYLNLAGINKLLEKHGLLQPPTETGEERMFPPTETGGVPSPETGGVPSPETGGVNEASAQTDQKVSAPLNTIYKNNIKKQSNQDCLVSSQLQEEAESFIRYALQKEMNIKSIQATKKRYLEARNQGVEHETMINLLEESCQRYGQEASPISVIQNALNNHIAMEEAKKKAKEDKAKRKARRNRLQSLLMEEAAKAGLNPALLGGRSE